MCSCITDQRTPISKIDFRTAEEMSSGVDAGPRGLTGGAKLYREGPWQFSLLGRYRYFDIPEEYQNRVQGNEFDVGGEARYFFDNNFEASLR